MTESGTVETSVVLQIRFRLLDTTLSFGGGVDKIAVFQHGQQLAAFNMIAAVNVKLLHGRGDFGRQAGLI